MKKILLIRTYYHINKAYYPMTISEPLSLEYLANELKHYDVSIFDALGEYPYQVFEYSKDLCRIGASDKQIINRIRKEKPDIIGISSLCITLEFALIDIVNLIKEHFPQIKIIVGGTHPSSRLKLLKETKIDVIVIGEGEETFKELLDNNFNKLSNIKGIAYIENGEIKSTPMRESVDINKNPIPLRSINKINYQNNDFIFLYLWLFDKFKIRNNFINKLIPFVLPFTKKLIQILHNKTRKNVKIPSAIMMTSRGCPNNCSFCSIHLTWGRKYRMRDAKNLLEEVDMLVKKYKVKQINIIDDNFTVSKKRVIEFCKGIVERKYDLKFICSSGVFIPTLDEEVLTWMKKAGFDTLSLGIESGNQRVLDNLIHKNMDLKKANEIINICKKLNIYTIGFFMMGIPGETLDNMADTLTFILNSKLDRARLYICQPMPNTQLYNMAVEKGWLKKSYNPVETVLTGTKCQFDTPFLSSEDVERFVKNARKTISEKGKYHERIV